MENTTEQLEALRDIRQMMKQSSRFLSLSGFSGILAGVYALAGATCASRVIEKESTEADAARQLLWISLAVLAMSLLTAIVLSNRKARKKGYKLMDHTAWRMMINMMIPLATGGIFCLALLFNGYHLAGLIVPAMLIFYGLALVNASKYTLHEIRYLGCMEIAMGLIAAFQFELGLILWSAGFGVLHIVYGAWMWFKYDRL